VGGGASVVGGSLTGGVLGGGGGSFVVVIRSGLGVGGSGERVGEGGGSLFALGRCGGLGLLFSGGGSVGRGFDAESIGQWIP
jgi:hypothetical protein